MAKKKKVDWYKLPVTEVPSELCDNGWYIVDDHIAKVDSFFQEPELTKLPIPVRLTALSSNGKEIEVVAEGSWLLGGLPGVSKAGLKRWIGKLNEFSSGLEALLSLSTSSHHLDDLDIALCIKVTPEIKPAVDYILRCFKAGNDSQYNDIESAIMKTRNNLEILEAKYRELKKAK